MSRRLLGLVVSAFFVIGGFVVTAPAVGAGSDGQHLSMFDDLNWTQVCYDGTNQAGDHTNSCGPAEENAWFPDTTDWWVGWTDYGNTRAAGYSEVYVPHSQTDNYTCFYGPDPSGAYACATGHG